MVLDVWAAGSLFVECDRANCDVESFSLFAVLQKRALKFGPPAVVQEADEIFGLRPGRQTFSCSSIAVSLAYHPQQGWELDVIPGPPLRIDHESPAPLKLKRQMPMTPDLFAEHRVYRRYYDRAAEKYVGGQCQRRGDLRTVPAQGETMKGFRLKNVPMSLPYRRWGIGNPIEPLHGMPLLPGWRRSSVNLGERALSWPATEPIGIPLKFESVDVTIVGVRRGDSSYHFTLADPGFTWVRQGEAGNLEGHRWFATDGPGAALDGEIRDWKRELWDAGLSELLVEVIGAQLGSPVVELLPLIDDLQMHRAKYDAVYQRFCKEHGEKHGLNEEVYKQDRNLDLYTSSCDQRSGRPSANEHIPTVLELDPAVSPPLVEACSDFNRRPARQGLNASHTAAAWPAHIDLVAEGAVSHLMRAAEVGDKMVATKNYSLPGDIVVPKGTVLHREMMQCWVPRELITCMPLALFHDFGDGAGPLAVVPELRPHDVLIWRTGHVLHGALTAYVRGKVVVTCNPWEALGIVVINGGVSCVNPGGLAHQEGVEVGDVLAAMNGKKAAGMHVCKGLAALRAALHEQAETQELQLIFELSRFNGRRSIEFRFFVYWPA